jgi:uncharacterized membrane protein YbhN (UPF0104 family)
VQQASPRLFSQRQLGLALVGAGIGLVFCWLAFRQVDWSSLGSALAAASWGGVGVALLLKVGSDLVRAVRWRCLWTEHDVSVTRLYVVETAAVGANNLSPVHVLDEPLILALLTVRDRLPAATVLATMLMTRVQDLGFTVLFAAISVMVLPGLLDLTWPLALFSATLIGALVVIFNLRWFLEHIPLLGRTPAATGFSAVVVDLRKRPKRLALTFGLTVAYWAMLGPAAWVLGESMGVHLPVHQMTVIVIGAISFGTAVPSLPGGIGTFEWAVVTLLGFWGVDLEQALGFAIILHVLMFLPSTTVTIIALPREGIGSLTELRRLLARASASVRSSSDTAGIRRT